MGQANARVDGTRERIIRLLLAKPLTIEALALGLGITKNAVRSQIALLQGEGLVGPAGSEKGARRPAVVYEALAGADEYLSRAYPAMVSNLVRAISRDLSAKDFERVMTDAGKALASGFGRAEGSAAERARAAVACLESLGSTPSLIEEKGGFAIESDGCPVGLAVSADRRSCLSMEAMLRELTGLKVASECRHDAGHRCRFVLSP